tara:strand:- start:121 stop:276 length:156 start_codon:yes stop_codon:yes gene_type:complete
MRKDSTDGFGFHNNESIIISAAIQGCVFGVCIEDYYPRDDRSDYEYEMTDV